ncbi:MAG: histidine phosphatase family protein [Candidatus Krumholzibacteriota bacterium]|nr:histidine phosphatase family protein [Candidatus Krumholzibacteriota bacterium]
MATFTGIHNLKTRNISKVWTSPLEHAKKTAMIASNILDLSVNIEKGLSNLNTGLWEGKTVGEIQNSWPAEWKRMRHCKIGPNDLLVPGGEILKDFHDRVVSSFLKIVETTPYGKSIAVFGHNLSLGSILAFSVDAKPQNLFRFELYNCSISLIEFGQFGFKLISTNDISFLVNSSIEINSGALSGKP